MRILMITQELDRSSPLLGVAHDWARAIADRVSDLTVVAGRVGSLELPDNVSVLPMRRNSSDPSWRAGLELVRQLARSLLSRRVDLVFAHMVPDYVLLSAPFAKLAKIPICMWYASHGRTRSLRLAHRLMDAAVTASPDSYPQRDGKVLVMGHGIDESSFGASQRSESKPPVILYASRITPLKQTALAVEALGSPPLRDHPDRPVLEVAGEPFRDSDHEYLREVRHRVEELGLTDRVRFLGAVPAHEMPRTLARAQLSVSFRTSPALDKNGLEALLAGVPVVSNNPSYISVLGSFTPQLYVDGDDPPEVAGRLARLLDDPELRARCAAELRASVESNHGLSGFADRLVRAFEDICRGVTPLSEQSPARG